MKALIGVLFALGVTLGMVAPVDAATKPTSKQWVAQHEQAAAPRIASTTAAIPAPKNEWKQGRNGPCTFRVKQDLYTRFKMQALNDGCQTVAAYAYCFHTDQICGKVHDGVGTGKWTNGETKTILVPSEYKICWVQVGTWSTSESFAEHRYDAVTGSFTRVKYQP